MANAVLLMLIAGCVAPVTEVDEPPTAVAIEVVPTPSAGTPDPATMTPPPEATMSAPSDNSPTFLSPLSTPTRRNKGQPAPAAMQARLDLAGRLKVLPGDIEIVSVEKTEMPAGSLGCGPTSGVSRPGFIIGEEITLRAAGKTYTYRSDGRRLVPCSPADFPGGREPALDGASRPAQFRLQNLTLDDLSARLGMAKSAISVVSVDHVEWSDASLGCAKPGGMYAQVISPGYRFVLEADGATYEYHTDYTRVILCGSAIGPPATPTLTE